MAAPIRLLRGRRGGTARPPISQILRWGLVFILLHLLLRAWALSGSWFFFDDLAFMSAGLNDPLDLEFLSRVYSGHVMPGGWLVIKALATWAPYEWWAWAAFLLVLQAVAALAMLRLLRDLFGDTGWTLALLVGFLFYVFTVPAGLWFAAGINQLPLLIALGFGLHAHTNYLRSGRKAHLAIALLWAAFGLAFYEKSIILFLIYGVVALGWFAAGSLTDRLATMWNQYRAGTLAYLVVAVAYLALYLRIGQDFGSQNPPSSLLVDVAYRLVGIAFSTATIGGPLEWRSVSATSLANPSELVSLGSWVALGWLMYHAHRTRRMSRRAWWLIASTTVINVYLLSSARANLVGADIALEYRYQTEASAVFVLSLGLALLPLRGAVEINDIRAGSESRVESGSATFVAATGVVLFALFSTLAYVDNWQDENPTRPYFNNVQTGLEAAATQPVPLIDASVPQDLLWAFGYPENTYSHIFRHLDSLTEYPDSSVDSLYIFDDAGRLSPVELQVARSMIPGSGCGYILDDPRTEIPLDGPVIGGGWWIRMRYTSRDAFDATISLGERSMDVSLPSGTRSLYLRADGQYDSVVIDAPGGGSACVTDLVLGGPQAESANE